MKGLLVFVTAFLGGDLCGMPLMSVGHGFDVMSSINQDVRRDNSSKAALLREYYDANLDIYQRPELLIDLADKDVGLLFRAAYLAFFYGYQRAYLEDMRMDINVLSRKGSLPEKMVRDFYASLVAAREFGDAESFRRQHPLANMPAMPPVEDGVPLGNADPTMLALREEGNSRVFTREAANVLGSGSWVLVVSHQLCHFSQNASRAIAADPVLGPLFRDHAQWVAPQESALAVSSLAKWNRDHPTMPIAIVYKQSEWPMVSSWATPTFYFFKDGRMVDQVTGWPTEGNREALIDALRKNGLLK